MATKANSFRVNVKKKLIVLYTNVEQPEAEKTVIDSYLRAGYTPKFENKKPSITVDGMRKELEKAPDKLAEFNKAYDNKEDKESYFKACKIYSDWVKTNKKAKKEAQKAEQETAEAKTEE